jgi:hypothetical protein
MNMNLKYLHKVSGGKAVLFRMLCMLAGVAMVFACLPVQAQTSVLWNGDPNLGKGTSVFEGLEEAPGNIVVTNDPLGVHGKVFHYNTFDDSAFKKERCESRGTMNPDGKFRVALGGTYFIGWREMFKPMPINGSWVAMWQMHGYGPAGQGAPLVLRVVNGQPNLVMQNGVNGQNVNFWSTPLRLGVWNTFVVEVHLATTASAGWVQLWYNGVPQTFINGKTRYNAPLWDSKPGSFVMFKWGVYRSSTLNGKGPASTYLSAPKIGLTYADVNPN